jgi:exodeoxyribonuclease-3
MRIATFNANSIRSRLGMVLTWLKTSRCDVLCIQETKAQDPDFPLEAFTETGYHVAFRGEKSYNGVAVVSRDKPTTVRFGFDDGKQADETRLVYARLGPVHVLNTYVPQGRDIEHAMFRYKLDWFKRLRAYCDRHFSTRMKVVWVGDLNVAPEPMDVHNSDKQQNHVCHHIDVRKAYDRTRSWGFEDVFRKYHPEPGHYSFFDYRFPSALKANRGWRIDHILATPPLARKSSGCFIDLEPRMQPKPSDHTFVVADFDV